MVKAFFAPDNLFNSGDYPILIKDFLGKWRMSEEQAKELVRRTLAKLGYPAELVHFEVNPIVQKPAIPGIPRYMLYWNFSREGEDRVRSAIAAEVDADTGQIKSLYYSDMAYWNQGPKINAPILLPQTSPPDLAPVGTKPQKPQPPPQRPILHAVPPR